MSSVIMFPGQGAQHVGMGRRLTEQFPGAESLFEKASDILGYDLAALCRLGPAEELNRTEISQPALFVSSLAAVEKLKAEFPEADSGCVMTAGLSLGEYTALVYADAMSFEDALNVVRIRGESMQAAADATASSMVSILLLKPEQVEEICAAASAEGPIRIANYLCPGNLVVSGVTAACEAAARLAEEAGGRAIPLSVAGAFHTDIMKPADEKLAAALESVKIESPRIPVVSNVDAQPHSDPEEIRKILVRQVVEPVRWEDSINHVLENGGRDFYEVGPGKVLTGLLKRISRRTPCTVVNDSLEV